ncbi:nitroreductase family deazaflavin-dependent oxidoreductase [Phycicoccus sp. BSK3Z-2]|uniref:Nitroreductase family deazaflavin-dependent oxidoreductase n=1 Tax=Phycicoccus avicenniae TaxID=2828860 RepID=A0A941HYX2_9MICO|nr:nitroreductase/quinone reductase family protein [Phycicoccus avicenniae]MBR7742310.1 nitroreductase family deazaflavin-dependent oxidoreductase [Phycicoccus avicenniae]
MDVTTLPESATCELTTRGRRSGRESRIEIWYVVADGRLVITGTPGRRDWLANLRADPRARLHLRGRDVDVVAHEITDPDERRHVVREVWRVQPWYSRQASSIDAWVARAPIVVLREADTRAA